MKLKSKISGFDVLERAKVTREMASFIDKTALDKGWSRSQVIREALNHYMSYEESRVLQELQSLKLLTEDMNDRVKAMGLYEQQRFDQILKAVKAHRKA